MISATAPEAIRAFLCAVQASRSPWIPTEGVFTRRQAAARGVTNKVLRHRQRNGAITEVLPDIFRLTAVPFTWSARLRAAVLWADPAAVSHRSAAAIWALDGFNETIVEITTPRRVRSEMDIVIHRVPELRNDVVRERRGVPATTLEKTIFDLGSVCPIERVGDALDDALRQRLTTLDRLERLLETNAARGRAGSHVLRTLLSERLTDGYMESKLEKAFFALTRRFGLPRPITQYPVTAAGHTFRLDFAYPKVKLGIEALGYQNHSQRDRWERDQWRHNLLTLDDWRLIYVTYRQLCKMPEAIASQISALGGFTFPIP